jgi:hypothetical protein
MAGRWSPGNVVAGRRVELRLFVVQGKAMHLSSSLLFFVVFKTAMLLLFLLASLQYSL